MNESIDANVNIKHICASAHNIGRLRRFCRNHKIDDCKTKSQRQRLEERILSCLQTWMSNTGNTSEEQMSWVAYFEKNQLTKIPAEKAAIISDKIADWLIAMRAIEHAYDLLKNSNPHSLSPPDDIAFIGWKTMVNGGPGLHVVVNQATSAKLINWELVARDGIESVPVEGKPSDYYMPSGTSMVGYRIGMD